MQVEFYRSVAMNLGRERMKDNRDKKPSRDGDIKQEESKRRGVRDSGNRDAKSNTSQPSERKHRESSSSSATNESRRSGSSHDGRRTSCRDERNRLNHPRNRDDWRHDRHRYDRDPFGRDRRERIERNRHGRDLHRRTDRHPPFDWGDPRRPYHRRERCDSPPGNYRRSPVDHGRRGSYYESPDKSIDSRDSRNWSRSRSRSNHRSGRRYGGSRRSRSPPSSSGSVSSSSISSDDDEIPIDRNESTFSKDQRTVFVSQLVMRATEKDIRRYFRRNVGCKVKEVIFLRDKRTKSHKGGAYIEMRTIEDVNKAVAVSGSAPDFQRFPLLIKPSEAEKNYVAPVQKTVITASAMEASAGTVHPRTRDDRSIEVQNVYVGGLDSSVSEQHLFALFSQFGHLEKVTMQLDTETEYRRDFAFLSFGDPKVANLAIHTMANRILAGCPMRTGWASQPSAGFGVEGITSDEFPDDLEVRKERAFAVLEKLNGSVSDAPDQVSKDANRNDGMSDNQIDASNTTSSVPGIKGEPSPNILVHNMFDKDDQTEEGWAKELKEEFTDECSKFGRLTAVTVKSKESGGKIFATFDTVDSAKECSKKLSGRWFDKRQLQVEFVDDSRLPDGHI